MIFVWPSQGVDITMGRKIPENVSKVEYIYIMTLSLQTAVLLQLNYRVKLSYLTIVVVQNTGHVTQEGFMNILHYYSECVSNE